MVTFTPATLQGRQPQEVPPHPPGSVVEVPDALRDDVYRRPLATALARLGIGPGWRCVDVGAGGGDVSVALAEIVGRQGRVYAVDSDPRARDETAVAAAAFSQVLAITQAGEDLLLPEQVDLAFCRFLLMHVIDPAAVLDRMRRAVRPGGFLVAQEPITSAGRVDGVPLSMPGARHPDVGARLPALVQEAGAHIVDAWAEAPAGAGPGPVAEYLASLTGVDPGDDPVVLPPLVTVVGQVPEAGS
jgi:SAM-dependent methyltransferase